MMLQFQIITLDKIRMTCLYECTHCNNVTVEMKLLSQSINQTITFLSRCKAHHQRSRTIDGEAHSAILLPPSYIETSLHRCAISSAGYASFTHVRYNITQLRVRMDFAGAIEKLAQRTSVLTAYAITRVTAMRALKIKAFLLRSTIERAIRTGHKSRQNHC